MSTTRQSLGRSIGLNKVALIWDGNVSLLASLYKDTATKRRFRFYGIAIAWVMLGVTVASTHSLARGPAEDTCQDHCPYGTACDCQELHGEDARMRAQVQHG